MDREAERFTHEKRFVDGLVPSEAISGPLGMFGSAHAGIGMPNNPHIQATRPLCVMRPRGLCMP